MRRNAATILLFAAVLAAGGAAFVALTGGVAWSLLTLRDPWRPAFAGLALLAAALLAARQEDRPAILRPYLGAPGRRAARLAGLAAAGLLAYSLAWSSRAAGGSDSSCYLLQAEAFARGRVTLGNPVARVLSGVPNEVFAPAGFLPSRAYGQAVPICAPGLSLAMAAASFVHPSAVFLVVPLAAAMLVWLTFAYGRLLDGEATGAWSAVLTACSPIVLYQAVQPMSDVPAAAAWLAAFVSASPVAAGAWASVAVLIRPNLALLVPLLLLQRMGLFPSSATKEGSPLSGARLVLAAAPGIVLLLGLNAARYGSPLATGYGSADALFSAAHVAPNALRYARWLLETETPFVLLAVAAPWAVRRDPARVRLAWISLAAVALVVATYLAYTAFDDWWYIRFLLPALPLLIAASVAALRAIGRVERRAVTAIACAVVAAWHVHVARARHTGDLQALESRFHAAGGYAGRVLPADAVVLAGQQSGSVRYHGRRDTLAWDAIPPDAIDEVIRRLQDRGRPVYLALEEAETPRFRARFSGQRIGALEWPPFAVAGAPVRVRLYDVRQRAPYLNGERIRTELVR